MNNNLQKFENENGEHLRRFLDDYNPGHDDIQIKHFIVERNGITDYGQYKQAIAEVHSNYEALKTSHIALRKAEAKIAIYKAKKGSCTPEEADYYDILVAEKLMAIESIEKAIKRNMNELTKMFALASEFEKKIAGKDRYQLEREFWIANLSKKLAVNTVWKGGNLSGVMEVITSLPEDMQIPLLHEYKQCLKTDLINQHLLGAEAQAEVLKLREHNEVKP